MIKIKDYIFNENEIREIKQCKNYLRLDLTYSGPYLHIDDANYEDIEWNYGATQNATQETGCLVFQENKRLEELKGNYIKVIVEKDNKIKELEEENKTLKELNVCVGCNNNPDYKTRIDKAIKYIKEGQSMTSTKQVYISGVDLLKILKGEK